MKSILLKLSFICCIIIFISENIFAQVTVGSCIETNRGSLLDLKESSATKRTTSDKGISMPRVKLTDINNLYPMFWNKETLHATSDYTQNKNYYDSVHTGLVVYNINKTDGICPGIYIWNGTQWNLTAKNSCDNSKSTAKNITSFFFDESQTGLPFKLFGIINQSSDSIIIETQSWINNPENMAASFVAEGEVYIGGIRQYSGQTTNDFRKRNFTYTVTAEDGSTKNYTVIFKSPQSTGLPLLKIDVENNTEIVDKENYLPATIKVSHPDHSEYDFIKDTNIRGRGNTSWNEPKKPYRIKFNKKTSIFGYGAAKSWVLLASYQDPTLILNSVAFDLSRIMGLEYSNHANHVELFLNGYYAGSYVLTEQVQVGKERVNIDEDSGIFIEMDRVGVHEQAYNFYTDIIKLPIDIKSPEKETLAGYDFVKEAVNNLEYAILGDPNFPNNNYKDLIDINSIIDYMLFEDLVRNGEILEPKSTYMYKDANSKFFAGPVWDHDWGFGYKGSGQIYFDDDRLGTLYDLNSDYKDKPGGAFFTAFLRDPDFCKLYKKKWNELKNNEFNTIDSIIDKYALLVKSSYLENNKLWPSPWNFDDQIVKMQKWIKKQIELIDKSMDNY